MMEDEEIGKEGEKRSREGKGEKEEDRRKRRV